MTVIIRALYFILFFICLLKIVKILDLRQNRLKLTIEGIQNTVGPKTGHSNTGKIKEPDVFAN